MARMLSYLLLVSAAITTSLIGIRAASSEEYPTRLIRIVSPHPAGVATDVLGRALAQRLTETLGQTVIVENRPGANGMVAAAAIEGCSGCIHTAHYFRSSHSERTCKQGTIV